MITACKQHASKLPGCTIRMLIVAKAPHLNLNQSEEARLEVVS